MDLAHHPTSASSHSLLKYFDWPLVRELGSKIAGSALAPTNPREDPVKMSLDFCLSSKSPYSD